MSAQQSAQALLTQIVNAGGRPGRPSPFFIPGVFVTAGRFVASSTSIQMQSANPGSVAKGMQIFDLDTDTAIAQVQDWTGKVLTLGPMTFGPVQAGSASAGNADLLFIHDPAAVPKNFAGAVQSAFFAAGYSLTDLVAGLAFAVNAAWLTQGHTLNGVTTYTLEQAGFAAASGTAPTSAASGQRLVDAAVAQGGAALSGVFELSAIAPAFIGTVGDNTFAPEDLIAGYAYAFSQGWVRPSGANLFDPVFTLTAAGVAAAT